MLVRKSRSTKSTNSRVEFLEKRMLLAAFTSNPITFNSDFVGSTASVGPDGYTDIGLKIEGLKNYSINSIRGTANTSAGDLNWAYGDLKNGLPYAEFIRSDYTPSCGTFPYRADYNQINTGTIYISPLTNSHYNNITVQLNLHNDLNNTNYSENLTFSPNYSWSPTTVFTGRSVTNLPVYGGSATFDPNQAHRPAQMLPHIQVIFISPQPCRLDMFTVISSVFP